MQKEKEELNEKRILLVDDCEINLFIIKSILDTLNIKTSICMSGMEAIMMINKSKCNFYNLILMDIQMPEMDGIETTKRIRMIERNDCKNIPIIAISATYPSNKTDFLFNNGFDDFISKPIDYNIFIQKLINIFKNKKYII